MTSSSAERRHSSGGGTPWPGWPCSGSASGATARSPRAVSSHAATASRGWQRRRQPRSTGECPTTWRWTRRTPSPWPARGPSPATSADIRAPAEHEDGDVVAGGGAPHQCAHDRGARVLRRRLDRAAAVRVGGDLLVKDRGDFVDAVVNRAVTALDQAVGEAAQERARGDEGRGGPPLGIVGSPDRRGRPGGEQGRRAARGPPPGGGGARRGRGG